MGKQYIDNKTIIIHLLKEIDENSVSVKKVYELSNYIYDTVLKMGKLNNYRIPIIIPYSIMMSVLYNSDIFEGERNSDGYIERIQLRRGLSIDELSKKYDVDDIIRIIIQKFVSTKK